MSVTRITYKRAVTRITRLDRPAVVRISALVTSVVRISKIGPQGPAGADGTVQTYVHDVVEPINPWVINHGLHRRPATVRTVTPGGVQIFGSVQDITDDQTIVTFSSPQAGRAFIL